MWTRHVVSAWLMVLHPDTSERQVSRAQVTTQGSECCVEPTHHLAYAQAYRMTSVGNRLESLVSMQNGVTRNHCCSTEVSVLCGPTCRHPRRSCSLTLQSELRVKRMATQSQKGMPLLSDLWSREGKGKNFTSSFCPPTRSGHSGQPGWFCARRAGCRRRTAGPC